jgi:hypothetical protein
LANGGGQLKTLPVTTQQTTASAVPAPREPADAVAVEIESPPATPPWGRSLLAALWVFAALRVAYLAVTVLGRQLAPGGPLIDSWLQWDATKYLNLAQVGYGSPPQDIAFFPLFPLLVHAVDVVLPGNFLVAGLVVTNLAAYGALVLLHRLVATDFDLLLADRTIYLLGVFPTAYFLAAPYNHSLFLVLVLGCLYAIRRRAWWVAGALGALASGTRITGIFLVGPFVWEYLRLRGWTGGVRGSGLLVAARRVRFDALAVVVVPIGLIAFSAFCAVRYGDPLAFSHAQSYWAKHVSWPGYTLWEALRQLAEHSLRSNYALIGDLAGTALGVALLVGSVWGRWALPRDHWYLVAYAAPVLLMPLFYPLAQADPISGMARYLLDVSVLFVVLARALSRPFLERAYVIVALTLQVGYLLMFLRGLWTF